MGPELPRFAVLLVTTGILLSLFLVALDRTIVSTAIPAITNEFNSLEDYGWYGSSYLLSTCALQLLFGKLFTFFSVKYMLFGSVLAFEIASAICGAAPTSTSFIIGRAIAGIGAAGIFAGAMTSMVHVVPLHHKPKLFAAMGSMQVVAQIGGPLIGGAFTTHATWRWCFYINLPIGAVAMIAIALFLNIPQQRQLADKPLKWKPRQLDYPGTILAAAGAICILLALQWGGQTYAPPVDQCTHHRASYFGITCLFGFIAVQILFPETATLPMHLFRSRSVVAAILLFVFSCSNFVLTITHVSAAESGVRTIPLMAASVVGLMLGGISTTVIGYYVPGAIAGACLATVGAGLISTWRVDSPEAIWVGYQVINGIGLGFVYQIPNLALQAVLPKRDAPIGFAAALFGGLLFSSVLISVGENVLVNQLVSRLSRLSSTPIDASPIYSSSATTVLDQLPTAQREAGLIAYNDSLRVIFQIGLALSAACVPFACALEWKSVQAPLAKKAEDNESSTEATVKTEGPMGKSTLAF
ncbi:MFS general substrate transporter [Thozetella sp. PMI_491]|nr:MFS general substrate transporter [Thozetella sp. PMI_491]